MSSASESKINVQVEAKINAILDASFEQIQALSDEEAIARVRQQTRIEINQLVFRANTKPKAKKNQLTNCVMGKNSLDSVSPLG